MNQMYSIGTIIYDPKEGTFHRRFSKKVKFIPGATNSDGYKHYKFEGKSVSGHKLVFMAMGVEVPEGMEIDHIDRDKSNNKWSNLILRSHSDNMTNVPVRCKAGALGVSELPSGRWRVRYKDKHIGVFDEYEDAVSLSSELRRHDKVEADV